MAATWCQQISNERDGKTDCDFLRSVHGGSMSYYELELAENIWEKLESPYAFHILGIGHYLFPLRELVECYSDDELDHIIRTINLTIDDALFDVRSRAVASLRGDEDGYYSYYLGPHTLVKGCEIKPEEIMKMEFSNFLSYSDFFIFMAYDLRPYDCQGLVISPHETLILAALSLYSKMHPSLIETDSVPLYHGLNIKNSHLSDRISEVNVNFIKWLLDIVRLVDESYRLQGTTDIPLAEESISLAKIGQIASDSRFMKARELAREIAIEYVNRREKPGVAAKNIRGVISVDVGRLGLVVAPAVPTIYGWISHLFPEELKTRGRPRKKN